MKFSLQPFNPAPFLNRAPAVARIFGDGTPESREADAEHARQKHERNQGDYALAMAALTPLVPANCSGYVAAMDCGNDTKCCNAARQLYRVGSPEAWEWLDTALRARFGIPHDESPASWLRLTFDWSEKKHLPAAGSTWSDMDFRNGPQRPDEGN